VARLLSQLPLPLLPAGAQEIARGVGIERDGDGGGVVHVHGLATFAWDGGDEVSRRLAAVQLVRIKAASRRQVAAGFGADPVTVGRWDAALREGGAAALAPERKGPRGPSKLTAELAARIRELRGRGLTLDAIAAECGVSDFTVRSVLGKVPARRAAVAALAGDAVPAPVPVPVRETAGGQEELPGLLPAPGALPVLPGPVPREAERALARSGLLGEGAVPVFTAGASYPLAGLLLALPGLEATGLLACARQVYGKLRDGFYGLEVMLVFWVLVTLAGEPRAEGAGRAGVAAVGRVLGLDRAPEVKTIRRKLAELAGRGKAADLQLAIAESRAAAAPPDELGFLYVDGHMRAYFGTRDIQAGYLTRLKRPGPATDETWVATGRGNPLLVVIGEPSDSLAAQVRDLLPALRQITGEHAAPVLCFDRGGWSPNLFADLADAGFGFLTWRLKPRGKDPADLPGSAFTTTTWTGDDGKAREYDLADTGITLTIASGEHKGRELELRQVTRRAPGPDGKPRQAHMLTTIGRGELPAAAVTWRMTRRWREENYFRYARARFALDALDTYAVIPDNPGRLVPNPAKKKAAAATAAARKTLAAAEAASPAAAGNPGQAIETARRDLAAARKTARAVPARIPLAQHNPDMVRPDTETKLITHAIRMAAYNTEIMLARALHGRYARAADEAADLAREALRSSGDIIPSASELLIRLDPLSTPRRTRAIADLCHHLNQTPATYPGTTLTLRYDIKNHPGTT
jgi:hypothetical protein